jgi:YVTN family beta-propeller protein
LFTIIVFFILSISIIKVEKSFADSLVANLALSKGLAVDYNPSNNSIYFAYESTVGVQRGYVAVIDSSSNIPYATIEVGDSPVALEFNPNNNMYVGNEDSNTVSVIDSSSNSVISTTNIGYSHLCNE